MWRHVLLWTNSSIGICMFPIGGGRIPKVGGPYCEERAQKARESRVWVWETESPPHSSQWDRSLSILLFSLRMVFSSNLAQFLDINVHYLNIHSSRHFLYIIMFHFGKKSQFSREKWAQYSNRRLWLLHVRYICCEVQVLLHYCNFWHQRQAFTRHQQDGLLSLD